MRSRPFRSVTVRMVSAAAFLVLAWHFSSPAHSGAGPTPSEPGARVETKDGIVAGRVDAATISFLGVPYAKPPVGDLRWQPPQPADRRQEVLDAARFRNHCPDAFLDETQRGASEDCLFLNVYAPRKPSPTRGDSGLLPVTFWVHGGGNGGGASEYYDPTPLVTTGDGAIVVSVNYRLGPFGFLAHPALDTEGHPAANYGILDQQLALKWVRDNIERFGGDAANATIFGQSSGGLNVTTHLVSPLSAGLFQRAIIQSGSYELDTPTLAESERRGVEFARRAGCADQSAACLRALAVADVLTHAHATEPTSACNQSTVDGRVLVETQRTSLAGAGGRSCHPAP